MNYSIDITDEQFEYLRLQKGRLEQHAGDRATWHRLYQADLQSTFEEIRPHLPAVCWGFLDVGSGLGGIDLLIARHYFEVMGQWPYVYLLDGLDDPPRMILHRRTYNDMAVARRFLVANGLPAERFKYFGPDGSAVPLLAQSWDLVVSFGSWCFHYEPNTYLQRAIGALVPNTPVIVELRTGKEEWTQQLAHALIELQTLKTTTKWRRVLYGAP